jgi:hypothetical protein
MSEIEFQQNSNVEPGTPALADRREALAAVGKFAAYASPAMIAVLTSTRAAHASLCAGNSQNGNGNNCNNNNNSNR